MRKKLLTLLLAVAAGVGTMFAWDYERVQIGDLYYNFDATNQTAEVTLQNISSPDWSVTIATANIPSSVKYNSVTYSVTSIGEGAFAWCISLTSVTIPNSVTSIGEYAFSGCSGLTSVTIPNSVTSIGSGAFYECTGLTSVTIPNSVTSIGEYAFYYCTGLTSVTIPNSVTSIAGEAFRNCSGLTSIEIPNSVTSIGSGAFAYCSGLTSVSIPNSVTSIGSGAFYGCSGLTSVIWNAKNYADFASNNTPFNAEYYDQERYQRFRFDLRPQITSFTFGNEVEHIPANLCNGMSNLTSVTIPNSVTSIGEGAFSGCSGLTSVTIPNSVTSIGSEAFYKCTGLTSPVYNAHVFAYLPTSYSGAYTIPDGIESIAGEAFRNCTGLTSVTIPNSVTSIGSSAFYGCTGLTSVTIPNSVTSIGGRAFSGCTSLTSVTIPNSVTSIGYEAFYNCTSLTNIFVTCGDMDRVKQLFNNDSRVKYKPLPYSVTVDAQNGTVSSPQNICDALELTATPNKGYHFTRWSDGDTHNPRTFTLTQDTTFTAEFGIDKTGTCGDDLALTWTYDEETKELIISGEGALNSNYTFGVEAPTSAEKVIFEEGVTSIGNSAFANYSTIQEISISSSVKKIYEQAFYNCENLQNIYNYRAQPAVVYSNTFDGIDKFGCKLYVPTASIDMYKAATGWRDFFYIEALVIKYKVTFLDWDETILSTQEVVSGEAAIAPADPTRTGYTFTGWDKDFSNVAEEMVVTAQYQINQYKVDFVDWEGMLLKTENVTYNTAATPPADPSREWYTFVGWDKEYSAVTADLVVTAQYEEGQVVDYNITFTNSRDNSEISIVPIQIEVPAPPVIAGFTFVNWEIVSGDIRDGFKVQAVYTADVPASAPAVYTNPTNPAQKLIRNGSVYILTDDKTYTITGQAVK